MRQFLGFVVPAVASVGSETFGQHLIIAGVSGAFGVLGVTLAAWVTTRRSRARIEQKILTPPPGGARDE